MHPAQPFKYEITMPQTLSTSLLNALKDRGAKCIFGIPGDFVLPFFKIIEDSEILPYYTFSHEPGVGYAADAAGRIDSTLGVAVVTYGAGALNMVNTVAQAYAEKSPLVVISGGPGAGEAELGLELHHQVKNLNSQFNIFKELTCDQTILNNPATAPEEIARVLDNAIKLSRPVYIELPRDLVNEPCGEVPPLKPESFSLESAQACAREIIRHLNNAENPAILVGVEARRYGLESKIGKLCKTLGLPVATSFMGRGSLVEQDMPLVGTYLGAAGDKQAEVSTEKADCLLMLGVIVCDTNFGVSGKNIDMRNAIRALDRTVAFSHHNYPDIPLEALVDALLEIAEPVENSIPNWKPDYSYDLPDDDTILRPSHVATAVNDLFRAKGRMPIASDVGDCLFVGLEIENTEFIAAGYYASMGLGVPAGMAINATTGKRPIVLVGDGAFQMTGWELGNCQKYGWSPIVILFNNRSWEMLRTFQPGPKYHDLDDWHYAEIAAHMGGKGVRVSTCAELKSALDDAYNDNSKFQLIEVMLQRNQPSESLARFANAIKKISSLGDA
jgi:indolepyruvate decarboxylase